MVIVLSVLLIKKKVGGDKPSKESYLEVAAEDMSAEDRHVACMQVGIMCITKNRK